VNKSMSLTFLEQKNGMCAFAAQHKSRKFHIRSKEILSVLHFEYNKLNNVLRRNLETSCQRYMQTRLLILPFNVCHAGVFQHIYG